MVLADEIRFMEVLAPEVLVDLVAAADMVSPQVAVQVLETHHQYHHHKEVMEDLVVLVLLLVLAAAVVLLNTALDLIYGAIDPRLRRT